MPSTFTTDPIGPRSVDEMLDVVYGRADALQRRRTMRRMAGGIAAVVLAVAATLTLQGSDEGASVRVVGDPKGEQEASAPEQSDGTGRGEAPAEGDGSASPPSSAPQGAGKPTPSSVPSKSVPSTTVLAVVGPPSGSFETWKTLGDAVGDATPADWYYDITSAAMEYDPHRDTVVFTTTYRSPTGSTSGRQERILSSTFAFDGKDYVVSVREENDQLGEVLVDEAIACPSCTPRFDAAAGRLVVTVPIAVLNEAVDRKSNGARLQAGAHIDGLITTTSAVGAGGTTIDADTGSADD